MVRNHWPQKSHATSAISRLWLPLCGGGNYNLRHFIRDGVGFVFGAGSISWIVSTLRAPVPAARHRTQEVGTRISVACVAAERSRRYVMPPPPTPTPLLAT